LQSSYSYSKAVSANLKSTYNFKLNLNHIYETRLLLMLAAMLLFTSCSKKNTDSPTPTTTTSTITINGTDYGTVVIGTQTWTTVNYNGTGGVNFNAGATNNIVYGKLYTLDEANAISLPTGWRVPTNADIEKLVTFLGGSRNTYGHVVGDATLTTKLMSKDSWTNGSGTNSTGFNAYPGGDFYSSNWLAYGIGGYFITSTVSYTVPTNPQINILDIVHSKDTHTEETSTVTDQYAYHTTDRYSVRFIKDN
jgi:uncharacterized protein (TIGR02145 family)